MLYVGSNKYRVYVGSSAKKIPVKEPEYFYVEHSSTGIIEKLPLVTNVDWSSLVTPGSHYGGLYSVWAGKGDYAAIIEDGQADTLTFVDGKLQDVNYTAYNGDVLNTSCRFTKANAYTSIQTPVKDTLYYICEPKAEYFTTYIELGYTNTTVDTMYLIIPIDSSQYANVTSFCKNSITQEEGEYVLRTYSNASIPRNGTRVSINATDLNPSLLRGYISYTANGLIPEQNTYYELRGQYTTADGYSFYTPIKYVYAGSVTTNTFVISDTPLIS